MTSERQPDAASSNTDIDQPHVEKPLDTPEQENVAADQPNDAENMTEKTTEGAPLDRAPSQAAKMGKNKIIVVMTALCVRKPPRGATFGKYGKLIQCRILVGSILGGFGYGTC